MAFGGGAKLPKVDLIETPCEADEDYPFGRRWRVSFASREGLYRWFHALLANLFGTCARWLVPS